MKAAGPKEMTRKAFSRYLSAVRPWGEGDWGILLVLVLLAVWLRIFFAVNLHDSMESQDIAHLYTMANRAVDTPIDTRTGPLYILFIRLAYSVLTDYDLRAVIFTQSALISFCVLLIYGTARRIFSRRAGIAAAGITAVYPNFILGGIRYDPYPFSLLIVTAVLALPLITAREKTRSALAGALAGTAILFEPILAWLAPGVLAVTRRRLIFMAAFFIVLAPWTIRNSMKSGLAVPVYSTWGVYRLELRKYMSRDNRWQTADKLYENVQAVFSRDSGGPPGQGAKNDSLGRNVGYAVSYSYTLILILGLAGLMRNYRREQWRTVLPVALYLLLMVFLADLKTRHRMPAEPLLIIYASTLFSRAFRPESGGPSSYTRRG